MRNSDSRTVIVLLALQLCDFRNLTSAHLGPGQWGPVNPVCLSGNPGAGDCMTPVHAILLRNGKVMLIDFLTSQTFNPTCPNCAEILLFDPQTESFAEAWRGDAGPNQHYMYYGGHHVLADGRVFIRSGGFEGPGNADSTLYDPMNPNPQTGFLDIGDEQFNFTYNG